MSQISLLVPARPPHEITRLLGEWSAGDAGSEQRLLVLLYPMLRSLARRELAVGRVTMRATELVHETYLRLADQSTSYKNRAHFLAMFARVLRRVVVDLLRHRSAAKRDRNLQVTLPHAEADEAELASSTEIVDWLALDAALKELSTCDPLAAEVVEARYFGGMNNDEIAAALDVGSATVGRHWRFARAWLHARLRPPEEEPSARKRQ
jgi:RNA polymerase sigma factor (TIGR02999 family)